MKTGLTMIGEAGKEYHIELLNNVVVLEHLQVNCA